MTATTEGNAQLRSADHARMSQDSCSSSVEMGRLLDTNWDDSDEEELDPSAGEGEGSSADGESFPEGGLKAWSVVAGAFCMTLPSFGLMSTVGTLEDYWHDHQLSAYTTRDIGWIPSIFVYLGLALGIQVG